MYQLGWADYASQDSFSFVSVGVGCGKFLAGSSHTTVPCLSVHYVWCGAHDRPATVSPSLDCPSVSHTLGPGVCVSSLSPGFYRIFIPSGSEVTRTIVVWVCPQGFQQMLLGSGFVSCCPRFYVCLPFLSTLFKLQHQIEDDSLASPAWSPCTGSASLTES